MPYKNKEDRLNYGRNYMKNKRVIPEVIPNVIPLSPHHQLKWAIQLSKIHSEFFKHAWFGRWKFELLQVHQQLYLYKHI